MYNSLTQKYYLEKNNGRDRYSMPVLRGNHQVNRKKMQTL